MRFSVKEQNEKKMFFHLPASAQKVTGLHMTTIKTILERGGNPTYHRKSDNKLFEILEELPIKILTIEGKDFFSLEQVSQEFGLSPTKFMNQVRNKKFAKQIDWISDELFPEKFHQEKEPDPWAEIKKLQAENEKLSARLEDLEAFVKKLSVRVEKCETQPSPEKCETQPSQQEVFQPPSLDLYSLSFKTLVEFILEGFGSGIKPDGPKTRIQVLVNRRKEYLPDLVTQILKDHVLPVMEKETEEEKEKRALYFMDFPGKINGMTLSQIGMFFLHLRKLKPELIFDLSKAIMKRI